MPLELTGQTEGSSFLELVEDLAAVEAAWKTYCVWQTAFVDFPIGILGSHNFLLTSTVLGS